MTMLVKAERLLALRNEHQRRSLMRKVNQVRDRLPSNVPFTTSTFCHRLWDRVFIDDKANVYTCCRHMPLPAFGNLYKHTLREAWNSRGAKFWRWMTARGALPCFDHCHLLSEEELAVEFEENIHTAEVPYENLRRVTMLFGELCNVACTMCDQNHRSKEWLTLDLVKHQIDWTDVHEIVIQGGEPLAIKECKKSYIYLTDELGKKVSFMTNGLLINDEWAERLAKHAPEVPISLNATTQQTYETIMVGAKWKKMRAAVERLRSAKERLDSPMKMRAHMTIVKENVHEIPDFVAFAEEIGFDTVDYGYDNVIPAFLEKNPDLFEDVKRRLPAALDGSGIEVDVKTLRGLALC
jgi:MoaA/NifB/PqqE/SkfB family radical SAM enzyme